MIEIGAYIVIVVLSIGAIAAVVAYAALARGFVLSVLWGWFAIPLGLQPINPPLAIGIALVVSFLTHQHHASIKDERETSQKWIDVANVILSPWLTLLMGYVIHTYWM